MLSIRPIGCSNQQIEYYANLGREDYYVKGGEAPGVWIGDGAKALSVEGQVSGEQLKNLLLGYSADGKKRLVQNAAQHNRRSAFDLTWSVPKSVSALWSQVSLEERLRIERSCENAVQKAAEAFQRLCGASRRGHDGTEVQEAKLAMALFRHETARGIPGQVPDPNLHWHLVVPNIAVRTDGTTGAFDARTLFQKNMKMALGALFRTELAKELLKLGLHSHRPLHSTRGEMVSWFELDGVPLELVDEMSKRRRVIESWLRKNGLAGAKNAEKAALATRQIKKEISRDTLFESWKAIGHKFGFDNRKILEVLKGQPIPTFDSQAEAAQAIERAIKRLTDHQARFTKTELLRFVAEESQCRGIGIDIVLAEVENTLSNSPDLVQLGGEGGQTLYTTHEMLQTEKQLFQAAQRLANSRFQSVEKKRVESVIAKFPTLRTEQADAVRHLTDGSDIALVNGIAGSGKTFMLKVADQIWRDAGYQTLGTCLGAKATQTLQKETGIKSLHIHQLVYQIENQKLELNDKSVLVVDESGMVGTRQLNKLFRLVESSGAKIVLVGDHRQLQAISAGAPFRAIAERVGCVELNQITRQRESWARDTVRDFRDGRAAKALSNYWKQGLLSISDDRDTAIEKLVGEWGRQVESRNQVQQNLIFAGTNMEVALINHACQSLLRQQNKLGDKFIDIGSNKFFLHDRIVITRNLHSIGLRNGAMGAVTGIDEDRQSVLIQFDDGYQVWINLNEFSDLKLAYAVSTHKGQGQTVECAFVLVGGVMTDRELTYVQSSRARGETRLYADRLTSGPQLDLLATQMSQSRAKEMAHDFERLVS